MSYLFKPKGYQPLLDLQQTELGISKIKDFFQANLSAELRLRRVTAPLFVLRGTGINDDLNGTERAVNFPIMDMGDVRAEVVHSLAKWKRVTLADYKIENGYGIYTDMNAIRADEELGNLHSLYVDQWDWERVMTAEELRQLYPDLTSKERETEFVKKHKAVFVIGIGGALGDGQKHDGRAPDYDDWSTIADNGLAGLNGDILLWNPVLEMAFEVSSMGIRVDKTALLRQLEIEGKNERLEMYFHKRLIEGSLPLSVGGGIGQSRLCMFFLRKAHIGEIQASLWPEEMRAECTANNIPLI